MKTRKLEINQIILVKALIIAIIATIFLYIYLVNMITFNTAARKDVVGLISAKQSQIGDLESLVLSESRQFDRQLAAELGLVKSVANETVVVVRDSTTRLTLNE